MRQLLFRLFVQSSTGCYLMSAVCGCVHVYLATELVASQILQFSLWCYSTSFFGAVFTLGWTAGRASRPVAAVVAVSRSS